ncbi:MAG: T9SS type A sorting domain-containing protein [Bacteroidales bacterium]|jgi:hypothetical protein|nr:T9SS type A sorting domain-containing protein [Bacteroidales bacterium]
MKKIILIIAVISFGLGLKAQNPFIITRIDTGDTINDSTIYVLTEDDEFTQTNYMYFTNITNQPVNLRMQMEVLHISNGATVQMCFGGNCVSDTITPVFNNQTVDPDSNTLFDLVYIYDDYTPTIIKINLLNADDLSILQTFKVYYIGETGLADVKQISHKADLNIYPNPAKSIASVAYTLPTECSNSSIIIKNMLGKEVRNIKINGNQSGKVNINIEHLSQGIYFCSIVCGETMISTKKMIVRH